MSRVRNRESELAQVAVAFSEDKAVLRDLCIAALRYAAAVFHNRKSRDRLQEKRGQWEPKP